MRKTTSEAKYFKYFNQVRSVRHTVECEYYLSFAVAICEGEISDILRVWANGSLVNINKYKHRLYYGNQAQLPDQLITASSPNAMAPAFRDLAYIVFEELPLADFSDSVPKFSFEVLRRTNIPTQQCIVEDLVKSIVMIPGSGEFVYDTVIQYKTITDQFCTQVAKKTINSHNHRNIANSVYSLDQLQLTCSNTQWVAPVVCWFGDDINIKLCSVRPAVEFNDKNTKYSEEWSVGNYNRTTAKLISRDENGNPQYGGSVNDASIIRYLQEIKRRDLKIMFYPIVLLDVYGKPWRGHITGDINNIEEFFNKDDGYNNFILHYARLVRDYVDAFVIGSELIGITKLKNDKDQFPAVIELCKLAKYVKQIVGSNVVVTYGADWSEYHHTDGGFYNLDELWASPYIDCVGIDAYFPVTQTTNSNIDQKEIALGWQSGEGYDYYYSGNSHIALAPEYAWKNLKYWWEHKHQNPNGQYTDWQPKMKKIWFTEFGFPSIDKATNQPNIFFDPHCTDGGTPRYSSGEIDFSIQRKAIKAFIEYWGSQEYIEQMFLWTWDARPYPAWPHMNIWHDGHLWARGHWVNNKFGTAQVASIILELSQRCDIALSKIDVSSLDEAMDGIVFNKPLKAMEAISILRIGYFFDIIASFQEIIRFTRRSHATAYNVDERMLLKAYDSSYTMQKHIAKSDIISSIGLYFLDRSNEYSNTYSKIELDNISNKPGINIKLPMVMSVSEVARLGKLILQNARFEDKIVQFAVPRNMIQYEAGDFVNLLYLNSQYQIRIVTIDLSRDKLEITGIIDDISIYYLPTIYNTTNLRPIVSEVNKLLVLDLPFVFDSLQSSEAFVAVYFSGESKENLYVSLSDNNYTRLCSLTPNSIIGSVVFYQSFQDPDIFSVDALSTFTIYCKDFEQYAVQNEWNLALAGREIIKFKHYVRLEQNTYKISVCMRGCFATEHHINSHRPGEDFVLLERYTSIITVSTALEQQDIYFKLGDCEQCYRLHFYNKSQKLLPPFIEYCKLVDRDIKIKWCVRTVKTTEIQEIYKFNICISDKNKSHDLIIYKQEYNVNFCEIGLSGTINISIIAENKLGIRSLPAVATIDV